MASFVTFISQTAPVDEYGRALYAVARSIIRALLDSLSIEDLIDLNSDRCDVTLRQLAKIARLDRDKGMRGDGFEWAVHEALMGGEPRVVEVVARALERASSNLFRGVRHPQSLLFGYERAKYLGFLDATVNNAGIGARLVPDGDKGPPFYFDKWVAIAAGGKNAEPNLAGRIKKVWKTDLFIGDEERLRFVAATVKSNWHHLESGPGLRLAIVPEAADLQPRIIEQNGLILAVLADPTGFAGLFNDAYAAVAAAITTVGKHDKPPYYLKPSAKAQRLQEQLEKYESVRVVEIENALDNAAQQGLVGIEHRLVSVEPPAWLHLAERGLPILAPKPRFTPL